jgi:cytochrome c-type biogenesis protein CcmH/NrfF
VKLVSVLLAALVLAAPAWAGGRPTAAAIETKLVCPVCHETLDQSTAPIAQEMKAHIRLRLSQGWTEKQILDEMVAQFGKNVLSTPATNGFDLLAWVLPIGGALVGLAALAAAALYWSRRDPPSPPDAGDRLDPETERRIDLELARFDG